MASHFSFLGVGVFMNQNKNMVIMINSYSGTYLVIEAL